MLLKIYICHMQYFFRLSTLLRRARLCCSGGQPLGHLSVFAELRMLKVYKISQKTKNNRIH